MKLIYKWVTTVALLFVSGAVMAQQSSAMMHFMTSLPQSGLQNPARRGNHKLTVVLPGLGGVKAGFESDMSFNDLFVKNPDTGKYSLGAANLASALDGRQAGMKLNESIDLLGVYYTGDKLGIRVALKQNTNFYAGDFNGLVNFFAKGNKYYTVNNEAVNLAPSMTMDSNLQLVVGGSYKLNNKLTVGANVNIFSGIAGLSLDNANISYKPSSEFPYGASIEGQARLLASSGFASLDTATNDVVVDDEAVVNSLTSFENLGFTFDFGATYQFNEKLTFEASILNLGSGISWSENLQAYDVSLHDDLAFEGVLLEDVIADENVDLVSIGDGELMNLAESDVVEAFTIQKATRANLGASYEVASNLTAGGLFGGTFYRGEFIPSFSASVDKEFGDIVGLGVSYNVDRFGHQLGAAITLGFPGFKFYVASDNLVSSGIKALDAQALDVYTGITLNFGRRNKKKKKSISKEPELID